MHKQNK